MEKLRVAFTSAEAVPFAKTGGLADVAGALPRALARRGHEVRVFMPLYSAIDTEKFELTPVEYLRGLQIHLGEHFFTYSVFVAPLGEGGPDVYFISCPQLYHRPGVYTGEWDEHLRFALLARATFECCQRMGWSPQILHANDWHASLVPIYRKTLYGWDGLFADAKSVLTIHNLAYQGYFPAEVVGNLGLSQHAHLLYQDDLSRGIVNFMKTGVLYADAVTTVSRTYAREIQTESYGEGLDALLRERTGTVVGIVNGIDNEVWNPATDPLIPHHYTVETAAQGKRKNKEALLAELGVSAAKGAPLLGIVSRLTGQKGFELLFEPLPKLLRHLDVRLVVLGTGEGQYEDFFRRLQGSFPEKVCYYQGYSEQLAHWIEAASDIFLMPSRFEPCGLNQMYSQRYGAVPIVRKTGGLADTVRLFDPASGEGTGFVFDHYDSQGMSWAIQLALKTHRNTRAWHRLRANGMEQDFSWDKQSGEYEKLYHLLLR